MTDDKKTNGSEVQLPAGGIPGLPQELQVVFGYRNAHVYPERVFIPCVNKAIDEGGNLYDQGIDARLARQAAGFARFASAIVSAEFAASAKP